jgi:predicted aminopeptidase
VQKNDKNALDAYQGEQRRNWDFVHLVARTREKLEILYGDKRTAEGKLKAAKKKPVGYPELRQGKQQVMAQLQDDYKQLKASWGGNAEYDQWFAGNVNNAQLNSVAAYYDLVPAFERLLELNGGDLEKFYKEAARLSKMPKKERHQRLRTLADSDSVVKARGT